MTSEDQQASGSDPTWGEFNAVVAEKTAQLEADYQEIVGFNEALINQTVRLEVSKFWLRDPNSVDQDISADSKPDLTGYPLSSFLYLRPDRQKEIFDDTHDSGKAHDEGDPYVITGEVPERTKKLIDDLLKSVEAVLDEKRSTPTNEVWVGNVAGQTFNIIKNMAVIRSSIGDDVTEKPTLSMRAVPVRDLAGEFGASVAQDIAGMDGEVSFNKGMADDLGGTVAIAAELAIKDAADRILKGGNWLRRLIHRRK